jgi:hypothetical protein
VGLYEKPSPSLIAIKVRERERERESESQDCHDSFLYLLGFDQMPTDGKR